jgi:hypothetical protein
MFSGIEDLKNNRDLDGLFAFLQSHQDESEKGWMARLDAAEALAQFGDRRGLEYLQHMAESPNPDIREIAREILDELEADPAEIATQAPGPALPANDILFFVINAKYPYAVAWAAFVILFLIAVVILNSFAWNLLAITQAWLPAWVSSLSFYLLLLIFGFLFFRFVIKIFVLPYENKS